MKLYHHRFLVAILGSLLQGTGVVTALRAGPVLLAKRTVLLMYFPDSLVSTPLHAQTLMFPQRVAPGNYSPSVGVLDVFFGVGVCANLNSSRLYSLCDYYIGGTGRQNQRRGRNG